MGVCRSAIGGALSVSCGEGGEATGGDRGDRVVSGRGPTSSNRRARSPRGMCSSPNCASMSSRLESNAVLVCICAIVKDRYFKYAPLVAGGVRQLSLSLQPRRRWGGRRAGAGRKPTGERAGMPHLRREAFSAAHPVHVTIRVVASVPSLRARRLVREFERSVAHACDRGDFRLTHYSLQGNHAHLIVEADDRSALARGMKAVGSRLARAVNRVFGRCGRVLADRYHMHELRTPREVWNAVRYVLLNARRHGRRAARLDPASSARWFDGWRQVTGDPVDEPPVARARSWLLRVGWRRYGPIDPADVPGPH